ncbi:MAG: hypothetical protein WCT22_00040 [Patescibacteria group bacterium]|jgi:hypothetical protein
MKQLNNGVIKVIKYFSFFEYNPTGKEIYTFLQAKIDKNSLNIKLDNMVKQKKISASKDTPPQYSIGRKISNIKYQISKRKLNNWRYKAYIQLLSLFPQIKLAGLSGSISMMNAEENDDVDLFIITAKNRLFTGRLITLVIAQLFGLRRSRKTQSSNNKICLNLFFDESNLKVPKFKQTEFVGHEVLQMKPIIIKGDIYKRFLEANEWVFRLFPNAKLVFSMKYKVSRIKKILNTKYSILNTFFNIIESIFKRIQLDSINKHRTTEIITSTQLWFHPDDFEKRLTELDK